jgi:hypothetical protein
MIEDSAPMLVQEQQVARAVDTEDRNALDKSHGRLPMLLLRTSLTDVEAAIGVVEDRLGRLHAAKPLNR